MRLAFSLSLPLVSLLVALPAHAADWYVSPAGTGTTAAACPTRATPCKLSSATAGAMAGDTVYLTTGTYQEQLFVVNSGTAASPITFKADTCATPIIESVASVDEAQTAGVSSEKGEYLVFEGLVVRGWNTGFGNHWADGTKSEEVSNGHWTIKHCISYSNGRTGFTFFSGPSYTLINSIAAHNGTSTKHSWSSGVTLFEATGTNLVQGVVSFENTDEENHTDGSGFIVDEASHGATFINNIAFGNSGSCLRLTKSTGTTFVNNTCYHNSQFGSQATGPSNPGELYFTNGGVTIANVNFRNNIIVGTGMAPAGSQAVQNRPAAANWISNLESVGATTLFTAPDGINPDFTLAASATTAIGKGSAHASVPTTDIGFDPKCLVKRTPKMFGMVAPLSRWQYDIDVDYVAMKGGVAKCFNGGMRTATAPDIGAYKAGAVAAVERCDPLPVGGGAGSGGTGSGGAASAGSGGSVPTAGASASTGGAAGSTSGGAAGVGVAGAIGAAGTAGAVGTAGAAPTGSGGAGAVTGTAGAVATGAGSGSVVPPAPSSGSDSGCGCRTASSRVSQLPAALGLLGVLGIALMRRRRDLV